MNVKYHFNFTSLDGKDNLVQFLVADTVTDTEITGMANPFVVELPELDSIFQVVRGTGATIQILSEIDMQFFDTLYTSDPFGIQVKHYIDDVLNWMGYVNSEMMQEPYSFISNYPVRILANNGLALLSRLSFVQADGSFYSGIKSKYDIIKICLDKIGLPYSTINISLSTIYSAYVGGTTSSILHELYNITENFYDEDPKPMTLREVIETVLKPYAAILWADGDKIYITDINTLAAGTDITYMQYDYATGTFIQNVTEPVNPAWDYMGTGQNIENSGGINKQVIDYSPYVKTGVFAKSINAESEFTTVPESWLTKDGYSYKTLTGNKTWQEVAPATFEESYYADKGPQLYLRWAPQSTNQKIASLKVTPFLAIVKQGNSFNTQTAPSFALSFEIMIKTKSNSYDDSLTSADFQGVAPYLKIKVGDEYYTGITDNWWTTTDSYIQPVVSQKTNNISDKFTSWTTYAYIMVLPTVLGLLKGGFDLEIWSDILGYTDINAGTYTRNPTGIQEVWIKNTEIKITKGDGSDLNKNDKEFVGLLDPNFQNEGQKITLKSGTNITGADLAQELYIASGKYYPTYSWIRAGQTEQIEKLLLNSYVSNFKAGTNKITNLALENNISIWKTLQDSYRSGRVFMMKSAKVDYWDNKIECDVVEIKQDELTIVDV